MPRAEQSKIDSAAKQLKVLKRSFRKDTKGGFSDAGLAERVRPILDKAVSLAELQGTTFVNDDDGDMRIEIMGDAAIELMKMIPEMPKPGKGETPPAFGGFPQTRAALWKFLILASIRGCSRDEVFADVMLKRRRLSAAERTSLRQCLAENLKHILGASSRNALCLLGRVTKNSEPLVVRAYMQHATSFLDDETLVKIWAR